ncbi:MAG: NUDIX hydrolase [Anaerolineales bacterium]|nr:NUDIX hydrolase [Anaerolineales bacterium]
MEPWRTLSRETLLERGKYLTVENHQVALPDGRVISDWPWVITPDYVNVLAMMADGGFLCFRQTKYAVEGTSLAPVGGYIDAGEGPLAAAQRELMEEAGCQAAEWVELGRYVVDGNRGVATAYLYLALGARQVAEADADDLEEMAPLRLSEEQLADALAAGAFKGLSWAMTVAQALLYIQQH